MKINAYRPLILIFLYLSGTVALAEISSGGWDPQRIMARFMGGFFLVFSFFKLLDLKKFVQAYRTYDIAAKASPVYALAYPFIELGLGISYIAGWNPFVTNLATAAVMGFSSIGVTQSLLRKENVECACLGTFFNLPMTKVTLLEDLLMLGMAAAMLLGRHSA